MISKIITLLEINPIPANIACELLNAIGHQDRVDWQGGQLEPLTNQIVIQSRFNSNSEFAPYNLYLIDATLIIKAYTFALSQAIHLRIDVEDRILEIFDKYKTEIDL